MQVAQSRLCDRTITIKWIARSLSPKLYHHRRSNSPYRSYDPNIKLAPSFQRYVLRNRMEQWIGTSPCDGLSDRRSTIKLWVCSSTLVQRTFHHFSSATRRLEVGLLMEVMEGRKTAFKDYYNSDLRPKQAEKRSRRITRRVIGN